MIALTRKAKPEKAAKPKAAPKAKSSASSVSRLHLMFGVFGLLMGFSLARIGFADFGEVHRLFTLVDLRLLFTFAGAVVFAMLGFLIFARGQSLPKKKIHPGTLVGGVLFGTGWALTGACPGISLVQIGSGYLPAVATAAGILVGAWLYKKVHARFFRWDTGACEM
jgi:uncharacterized membrane protein YedE/YeeE